jgi:transposase-like protein
MNQMEFEKKFINDQDCLKYLTSIRWPNGFICPYCNSNKYWVKTRNRYVCKSCMKESTAISGTIFHKSTKSLAIWFHALWWMVAQKNGVSAKGLQKILGLGSYQTAWTWLHKFRRLMIIPGREMLKGIVEVDETFIGGKKPGKRGRGAEGKSCVIIGVEIKEKATGRIRLSVIPNATKKSLHGFIKDNIEKGSTIITDDWRGYKNINKDGYNHKIENKKVKEAGEEILPHVHRTASLLKRWLLGTHQSYLNKNKLAYYLDEYTFRYNRRASKSRGLLFYRLIEQAVEHQPVTYQNIINQSINSGL